MRLSNRWGASSPVFRCSSEPSLLFSSPGMREPSHPSKLPGEKPFLGTVVRSIPRLNRRNIGTVLCYRPNCAVIGVVVFSSARNRPPDWVWMADTGVHTSTYMRVHNRRYQGLMITVAFCRLTRSSTSIVVYAVSAWMSAVLIRSDPRHMSQAPLFLCSMNGNTGRNSDTSLSRHLPTKRD